MAEDRFAGAAPSGQPDPYGYFGGTATTPPAQVGQATGSGSIGSAGSFTGPTASAPNVFAPPSTPFGSSVASYPGAVPSARRRQPWAAGALVVVLLAALGGGSWWWTHRDRLVLPDQLGGLQRNASTSATVDIQGLQQGLGTGTSDVTVASSMYGATPGPVLELLVMRGRAVSDNLARINAPDPSMIPLGPARCFQVQHAGGQTGLCMRADGDLMTVVVGGPTTPLSSLASDLQEAWSAQ